MAQLSRDLSHGGRHVEIAAALEAAGREREALMWLERGLAAHGPRNGQLRTALVAAYRRDGRDEDAVAVIRHALESDPREGLHRELRRTVPAPEWPPLRDLALAEVERGAARYGHGDDLVRCLLLEGEVGAAEQAAGRFRLSRETRMPLAATITRDRLDAGLAQYRIVLSTALEQADRGAYRRVVEVLRAMRKAAAAHGRADEVEREAAEIRHEYRRRTTLVQLLDRLGWWQPPG